jgi:putative hydrolase of the HAD superfamily
VPGTREALQVLREAGLGLVAVCNASGAAEQELMERGLRPFLDAVIDSHVVGFKKPDPRIFHYALALAQAEPGRTIHVGDLYNVDVAGARAAGLHAILIDPFDDWQEVDCVRMPDLLTLARRWSPRTRTQASRYWRNSRTRELLSRNCCRTITMTPHMEI